MNFQANNTSVFFPLLILLIATVLTFSHHNLSISILETIKLAPYAFAIIALWLSIQFSKRQLFIGTLVSIVNYGVIQFSLQQPLSIPDVLVTYTLLCLLVPGILLINQLLPEKGLLALSSLWLYLFLFVLVALASLWLLNMDQSSAQMIEASFDSGTIPLMVVSNNALAAIGICLGLSFFQFMAMPDTFRLNLFFILIANVIPLIFLDQLMISTAYISAALIIALFACIKNSHELAYRDQLTGLKGRRALFEQLETISGKYTLAMLDIDHFKKFNDTYGHDIGDEVLAMVASKIAQVGGKGQVYRYGGEEFTLVFPGKDCDYALPFLDEVRQLIADTKFVIRDQDQRIQGCSQQRGNKMKKPKTVQITVSIGTASKTSGKSPPEEVLKLADNALYKAKKKGRNRVHK